MEGSALAAKLWHAACDGHVEGIRRLVEAGADVNAQDQGGTTPLHSVAHKGHMDVMKVLVELGADVNALNRDGATPLHCAAHQGHMDAVSVLVEEGADAHAQNQNGATPLHLAAYMGHVEAVEMLVKQGADVNVHDLRGNTPAMNTANPIIKRCLKKSWKKQQPLKVATRWDLIQPVLHNSVAIWLLFWMALISQMRVLKMFHALRTVTVTTPWYISRLK